MTTSRPVPSFARTACKNNCWVVQSYPYPDAPAPCLGWIAAGLVEQADEFRYSATVMAEAVRRRRALLLADTASADFASGSIADYDIRTVMAVPIVAGERVFGALYLENLGLVCRVSEENFERPGQTRRACPGDEWSPHKAGVFSHPAKRLYALYDNDTGEY